MISEIQKKKLKQFLKGDYSSAVIEILNRKGIKTKFGKPFRRDVVRQVLNGQYQSQPVEEAIFELYEIRKNEALRNEQILN